MYGPKSARPRDGDVTASFECRQAVPSPCTGGTRHRPLVGARLRRGRRPQPRGEPVRRLRHDARQDGALLPRPLAPSARDGHARGRARRSGRSAGAGAAPGPARRRTTCTSPRPGTDPPPGQIYRGFSHNSAALADLIHDAERLRRLQALTDAALASPRARGAARRAARPDARDARASTRARCCCSTRSANELVARAAVGIEEEVEQGVRIPLGRGFAGRVAAEARPVILDDVDHADVLNPILREKGIKSLLGVPLLVARRGDRRPPRRHARPARVHRRGRRAAPARRRPRRHRDRARARCSRPSARARGGSSTCRRSPTPRSRTSSSTSCSACCCRGSATSSHADTCAVLLLDEDGTSSSRARRSGSRRRSSRACGSRSAAASRAASPPSAQPVILDDVDHADVAEPDPAREGHQVDARRAAARRRRRRSASSTSARSSHAAVHARRRRAARASSPTASRSRSSAPGSTSRRSRSTS